MNQENQSSTYQSQFEVDFNVLFDVIWKGKKLIALITILFSIGAVAFSFTLPNIYQSRSLLSPISEDDNLNSVLSSYSSLGNLAGINIGSKDGDSNPAKAIEKIQSLSFFTNNILPNIFLPDLMAVKSWEPYNNSTIYDRKLYDTSSQKWVRDFKYPQKQIPSAQESFKIFIDEHLEVSEDKKSGFVSISINHKSPYIAQEWSDLIVKEVNNYFRVKDKAEAEAALQYLNKQISQTNLTEIKQAIAQLLQQKTKQLSLIEVSEFYVFDYIDPPAIMEKKFKPNRAVICVAFFFIGFISGLLVVLYRHFHLKSKAVQK